MRIYVAGAWVEQYTRARVMIGRLRDIGAIITCDWTQAEGDVCACAHHRQRHAPMSEDVDTVLRSATACAECPCNGFNGIGAGGDSQLTAEARRKYAEADLKGVLDADVVWLLAANDKGACGSWVELGGALAAARLRAIYAPSFGTTPITIVSGAKWERTIFTELADHHFVEDEEAFKFIAGMSMVTGGAAAVDDARKAHHEQAANAGFEALYGGEKKT